LSDAKYPALYESVFSKYERDPEKPFFWKNGKLYKKQFHTTHGTFPLKDTSKTGGHGILLVHEEKFDN